MFRSNYFELARFFSLAQLVIVRDWTSVWWNPVECQNANVWTYAFNFYQQRSMVTWIKSIFSFLDVFCRSVKAGMRCCSTFNAAGISVISTFLPSVISSNRPGNGFRSTDSTSLLSKRLKMSIRYTIASTVRWINFSLSDMRTRLVNHPCPTYWI